MVKYLSKTFSKTIRFAIVSLIFYTSFSLSAPFVASFDASAEGWFLNTTNNGIPVVNPMSYSGDGTTASLGCAITTTGASNLAISGVSPSGTPYLTDVDSTGGASWYRSPDFVGLDLSSTIGGSFEFSSYTYQLGFAAGVEPNWMTGSGAPNNKFMKVQIEGNNGTIIQIDPATYAVPFATWEAGNWIVFSFPMDDATWSGTMADLTAVLSDVKNIRIRAEFIFGGDTADCATTEYFALDDVKILEAAPELTITKTADDDTLVVLNQVVTYTYVVTNSGNTVINNVTVSDSHNGSGPAPTVANEVLTNTSTMSSDVGVDGSIDVLAPGDFATFTGIYTITQADINAGVAISNTATATGAPVTGVLVDPTVVESVTVAAPELTITKTADDDTLVVLNQVVTYTYVVTNSGNIVINAVTVSDSHSGSGPAPTVANEVLTNTSTMSSDAAQNGSVDVLAPGDFATFTGTYTITPDDINTGVAITNTATATGTPVTGVLIDPTVDESVTVAATAPELTITKIADDDTLVVLNQVVTYTYVVTNSGDTVINAVTVSDSHSGSGPAPTVANEILTNTSTMSSDAAQNGSVDVLAPGDFATFTGTYTITQDDINAGVAITNTATATGTPVTGVLVDPTVVESVTVAAANAELTLLKTGVLVGSGILGDQINYTLVVTNTGNVTVTDVVIVDGVADAGSISYNALDDTDVDNDIDSLVPGESATVTAIHTIVPNDILAGEVINTAMANGLDPSSVVVSDVSDSTEPADDTGGFSDPNVTAIAAAIPAIIPVLNAWLLFLMAITMVFVVRKYNYKLS